NPSYRHYSSIKLTRSHNSTSLKTPLFIPFPAQSTKHFNTRTKHSFFRKLPRSLKWRLRHTRTYQATFHSLKGRLNPEKQKKPKPKRDRFKGPRDANYPTE